jgi:hypothetical protein
MIEDFEKIVSVCEDEKANAERIFTFEEKIWDFQWKVNTFFSHLYVFRQFSHKTWQFHTNLTQKKIFFTHSHTFSHKSSGFSHILTHSHTKNQNSHTKILILTQNLWKSSAGVRKRALSAGVISHFDLNAAGVIFKIDH